MLNKLIDILAMTIIATILALGLFTAMATTAVLITEVTHV